MKKYFSICLILFVLLGLSSCSKKKKDSAKTSGDLESGAVLVEVNGTPFTAEEFEMENSEEAFRSKDYILQRVVDWVETELLYQKARDMGLHERKEFKWELQEIEKNMLSRALLEEELEDKIVVTEEEVINFYHEHKEQFERGQEERAVAGLFFETKAEADEVYQKLRSGTKFSELILTYDEYDFGYITNDWQFSPEIAQAAYNIGLNQFSNPIETEVGNGFGYFIITVREIKKAGSVENFDLVKAELKQILEREKYRAALEEYLAQLKKEANIELNEELLGVSQLPEKEVYTGPMD